MKIGFFGVDEQEKRDFFIKNLNGFEVIFIDQNLDDENLPPENDFEIISIFVQSKVTQKVIDHFAQLKMIAIRSTGFDNVDTLYAKTKGIVVTNVPAYGSHTVAEFTFGLILCLTRNIPQAIEKVKTHVEFDHSGLKGMDLFGKTLGVLGTGKIGANVIKIAKGFGMNVVAFDLYPNEKLAEEYDFKYGSLDQVLQSSDIVTIHVPATKETHHLLNKDNIFKLKKGAYLINTARGDIIETEALYQVVLQKYVAGVGLDVMEGENELDDLMSEEFEPQEMKNLLEDNYLIRQPNVLVTPHTAFYTKEAEAAIMQTTVDNILSFTKGTPENVVNK